MTLPPPATPDRIAEAFVEAGYAENWQGAWDLLCPAIRENVTYASFTERMAHQHAYHFVPTDVEVTVDEIRRARGPAGPALAIDLRVTSDERGDDWQITHSLLVVEEKGELRICASADRPEA